MDIDNEQFTQSNNKCVIRPRSEILNAVCGEEGLAQIPRRQVFLYLDDLPENTSGNYKEAEGIFQAKLALAQDEALHPAMGPVALVDMAAEAPNLAPWSSDGIFTNREGGELMTAFHNLVHAER